LIARALPASASATFLAFNKSIATELSTRLPFPCSTFHSLCFKAVGKAITARTRAWTKVDAKKTDSLIDREYGDTINSVRSTVVKLVSLCKGENYAPSVSDEAITELIDRHDITWEDTSFTIRDIFEIVRAILTSSVKNLATVDFDDMLWLVPQLNVKLDTFAYVLVDEAQDTNPVQRAILSRLMTPTSRLIAVGDNAQAIYGFRGATSDALNLITEEFNCTTLPLSISYRCPSSVVQLAQKYGAIEARPNAPEGTVAFPVTFKLTSFEANDLVLCRNTAPLVTVAYRLIAARIPATIKGRDIGNGLKTLIKKLAGRSPQLDTLTDKVSEYMARETALALVKSQEGKAQSITDKCESIIALIDSLTDDDRAQGINGLYSVIDSLFSDTARAGAVLLSTVHKSKGLEAQRVIILDWKLCPSRFARQAWQRDQERNIQFVAVTRSKDTLIFVDSDTVTLD
jgi:ATP-dependent DNA helicase UvrD/PcrA